MLNISVLVRVIVVLILIVPFLTELDHKCLLFDHLMVVMVIVVLLLFIGHECRITSAAFRLHNVDLFYVHNFGYLSRRGWAVKCRFKATKKTKA